MSFLAVNPRVWVVLALLLLYALVRRVLKQKLAQRRRNVAPRRDGATLPNHITDGAARTWAVFTTPWCATCDPVVEQLRSADPASRVIKIDATVERTLADSLGVRSAPTTVLARADGLVELHLVGAEAVADYLRQSE